MLVISAAAVWGNHTLNQLQPITVSPKGAVMDAPWANDTYTFRFSNTSGKDLYMAGFKLRVMGSSWAYADLGIGLAIGSRKPIGDASPEVADIRGYRGRDKRGNLLFYFEMLRMPAGESREITLTRKKLAMVTVVAEPGYSTYKAQGLAARGGDVRFPLTFNESFVLIAPMAFHAFDPAKDIGAGPR
jgi:hypothetical protein